MPIVPFLKGEAFDPEQLKAMSWALDQVCDTLNLYDYEARRIIATRIIELAQCGVHNSFALRDRVLRDARSTVSLDEAPLAPQP